MALGTGAAAKFGGGHLGGERTSTGCGTLETRPRMAADSRRITFPSPSVQGGEDRV